jgi:hypothetical protein
MYSETEIAAFHEAGHARAAVRRGATVNGIDISWIPERARGWTDVDNIPTPDDLALYAYAGSWVDDVLLRPTGQALDIDELWFRVQGNNDDWGVLQKALGNDVSAADVFGIQIYAWERRPPPDFEVRPPIATVLQWHEELDDEWPHIQTLAEQLIDAIPIITVGAGPALQKVSESRWLRPGFTPDEALNQF